MSNDKPLVSGIIIFLNEEKYIEEAIESVFAQTYDNWELLLVDDGSTDRSTTIARHYAEKYPERVRYFDHDGHQNRGMSASRNLGVRQAQGKYVAFLDGDDVWLPSKLTDQVAILESQPEAAMLYGRTHFWYSWTGKFEDFGRDYFTELGIEPNQLVKPPTLLKLFLEDEKTIASTCSVLIRREVFDRVGLYEEDFRVQYSDMVFYTKLYLHEPVYVVDGCWDKYRHHPENSYVIPLKLGQMQAIRKRFLEWIEQYFLEQGVEKTDIWQVLQQQLWPYRHPTAHRFWQAVRHPVKWIKDSSRPLSKQLPLPIYQWLRSQRHIYKHNPPLGKVNWGGLRRLRPISQEFGSDRGQPIDRYYIENFLTRYADDVKGRVLEVGAPAYTYRFGGERVTKSDVLHIVEGNPYATIVGDLADVPQIPSDTFDCFILTQTLQYLYDVPSALKTIHRLLKPGGVVLVTLPNLTPIFDPDAEEDDGSWSQSGWYWGFTVASAKRLFSEVFSADNVAVESHGNVIAAIAFLQGLSTGELRKEELEVKDPAYQVLITVRAVKS